MVSKELSTPVIHIECDGDGQDRFLMGQIEIPQEGEPVVSVTGYDITTYFSGSMLQKDAEQVKLDLNAYMVDARSITIKFPTHNKWWMYS